ncbi:uncharacterized protein METZ01_LOCUS494274, partial [marine metagenome]
YSYAADGQHNLTLTLTDRNVTVTGLFRVTSDWSD